MKPGKILLFVLIALAVHACKKDKTSSSAPEPEPAKTGTLNLKVQMYDSLGNMETDASGVKIFLAPSTLNATTGVDGLVQFKDLAYGNYYPSLSKDWYEGAAVNVSLNAGSVTSVLPFGRFSMYKLINLSGQVYNKDSIVLSYYLTRPIPTGMSCKLAVIANDFGVKSTDFSTSDIITVNTQQVTKQNVANLPSLKKWLSTIKDSSLFYIDVIPVSYGEYYSNLTQKKVLLGRNPYTFNNLPLKKNW